MSLWVLRVARFSAKSLTRDKKMMKFRHFLRSSFYASLVVLGAPRCFPGAFSILKLTRRALSLQALRVIRGQEELVARKKSTEVLINFSLSGQHY